MTLAAQTDRPSISDAVTDEQLVRRLLDGESAAGDTLVNRHAEPMLRYLARMVGDRLLAEELFQQAWLSALEHLDRFGAGSDGQANFKGWLYRIATNKAKDHWRAGARDRKAKDNLRYTAEGFAEPAEGRAETTDEVQKLLAAVAELPEPQKEVVLLRYYSDLKFIEIAEILGCPLNTALGRMHKAMNKLKQSLLEPPD